MGRLFGTDGVRGVANQELTPELAFKLGRAGAAVLLRACLPGGEAKGEGGEPGSSAGGPKRGDVGPGGDGRGRPRIVLGRDTRISGEMLEAALAAGIASTGADVVRVGILPTPGVAYLTRALGAGAGAVISASHNPVADNGIKFFSARGFKLSEELEEEIESLVLDREGRLFLAEEDGLARPAGTGVGRIYDLPDAADRYASFLRSTVEGLDLRGRRIVIDCAFGAAWEVAPRVFRELGAEVIALHDRPEGARINVECGSTHPHVLQQAVRRYGAWLGLAHDGDADRVIAVDERGAVVDGDRILAVCALDRLRRGCLPRGAIAATVYSNLGLHQALEAHGGKVVVTPNGDRFVLEAMLREGLTLGGEQSGHIIFLEHNTTGDGILTALQLVEVLVRTGRTLSQAAAEMSTYPQVLISVRVRAKEELETNPRIRAAIASAEEALADVGRLLVRPSGTEPVVRVMGEGPDEATVQEVVEQVARVIQQELN
ncbi:MAG: phosphoglucosamine mutase [Bacillota bacterium]|nr:phosphoglucosamine mutase [Bacillota bacterium]